MKDINFNGSQMEVMVGSPPGKWAVSPQWRVATDLKLLVLQIFTASAQQIDV